MLTSAIRPATLAPQRRRDRSIPVDIIKVAGPPLPIQKPSPASRVIAILNTRWRVTESPPGWFPQWLLQRRQGAPGRKSTGWTNQSFCVSRRALKRCVREYCGEVDPAAQAALDALPATATIKRNSSAMRLKKKNRRSAEGTAAVRNSSLSGRNNHSQKGAIGCLPT